MAHDVFISYSSKDKPIADAICANLEAVGMRCWIAPRDIAPGEDWPMAVTRAISQSHVMVLVFSASSNSSTDVSRELFLAADSKLVIIPFKIENIAPEPGKQYYLARTHWLDAINPPTQEQIQSLIDCVKVLLPGREPPTVVSVKPVIPAPVDKNLPGKEMPKTPLPVTSVRKKGNYIKYLWIPAVLVILACVIGVGVTGVAVFRGKMPTLPSLKAHTATPTTTNLPGLPVGSTFTPTPDFYAKLGPSGSTLFSGPGEGFAETVTAFGDVTIIGQAYDCAWFQVVTNSKPFTIGWISADKLTYTVKCSDVQPVEIPPTPMATAINTSTSPPPTAATTNTSIPPTKTPLPATPVITPGPTKPVVNCQINSNILISNRSGSPLTLYLTGPASFTFTLGLDENTVMVCAGTYNYTIYGTCNGAPRSGSGKISDGDNIYFSCD